VDLLKLLYFSGKSEVEDSQPRVEKGSSRKMRRKGVDDDDRFVDGSVKEQWEIEGCQTRRKRL
jgi:hypothetical protein